MKKVLIVNLDQEERVAYSVMVAASLLQVNSETKISFLCSSGAKVLKSVGIFENVFESTSAEISNQRWDFIINHSSGVSSAALISMLDCAETIGPILKDQKIGQDLIHQSFCSYMLTEMKGRKAPCHISHLYFEIANIQYKGEKLPSIWKESDLNALTGKFDELRANFLKKRIVLIDSAICKVDNLSDLNFLIQLVKSLDSSHHYHPVLLTKSVDEDSFIISKIKEAVMEEMTIASVNDDGLLALLASVDMVITSDFKLKAYSDLVQKPSIFLNREEELPVMDFSMNPGSVLYNGHNLNLKFVDSLLDVCDYVSGITASLQSRLAGELYKTVIRDNKVMLEPLTGESGKDYYKMLLCNRFLFHLEKFENKSEITINESDYRFIISDQKDAIRNTFNNLLEKAKTRDEFDKINSNSEVLLLALDYIQYQKGDHSRSLKKFLTKTKPAIQDLMNFLNSEEARYS